MTSDIPNMRCRHREGEPAPVHHCHRDPGDHGAQPWRRDPLGLGRTRGPSRASTPHSESTAGPSGGRSICRGRRGSRLSQQSSWVGSVERYPSGGPGGVQLGEVDVVAVSAEAGRLPGQRSIRRCRDRSNSEFRFGSVQRPGPPPRRRRRDGRWSPGAPAGRLWYGLRIAPRPSSLAPSRAGRPSWADYRLPAGERRIAEVARSAAGNQRDPCREAGVLSFLDPVDESRG
jgi:hypothetical protein